MSYLQLISLTNEEVYNIQPWKKDETGCKLLVKEIEYDGDKCWILQFINNITLYTFKNTGSLRIDLFKALYNEEIALRFESICNKKLKERKNNGLSEDGVGTVNSFSQRNIDNIGYIKHVLFFKFNIDEETIKKTRLANYNPDF